MKKVYSLVLFYSPSTDDLWHRALYPKFLSSVLRSFELLFAPDPEWELHIGLDMNSYNGYYYPVLFRLAETTRWLKVYSLGVVENAAVGSLSRMRPIWDANADFVFCRDVDSLPTPRDKWVCDHFVHTGNTACTIADHPGHYWKVMTGMMGFRGEAIRNRWDSFDSLLSGIPRDDVHVNDQIFLHSKINKPPLYCAKALRGRFPKEAVGIPDKVGEIDGFTEGIGVPFNHLHFLDVFNSPAVEEAETFCGHPARISRWHPSYRWVVLGVNDSGSYAPLAPITAMCWREYGWRPVILLCGRSKEWWFENRAFRMARQVGAECIWLRGIPLYKDGTIAQVGRLFFPQRLHVGGAMLEETDLAMTGDVDMLPLSPDWFEKVKSDKDFYVIQEKGIYKTEAARFPLCYLAGSIRNWREVLGHITLRDVFHSNPSMQDNGGWNDFAWNFDERFIARRLLSWRNERGKIVLVERPSPPKDRLDRDRWPDKFPDHPMTDAHLLRPWFEHQDKVLILLRKYHPQIAEWAPDYFAQWKGRL